MPAKKQASRGELPARLAELQRALELTDADFAALFKRQRNQAGAWRRGEQLPRWSLLEMVAKEQGWPVEMFRDGGPSPADCVNRPVNAPTPPHATTGHPGTLSEATVAEMDPRQVVRAAALAIADYRATVGADMPFERLTWWLGKVFEAGGRETRQALAALERVSRNR